MNIKPMGMEIRVDQFILNQQIEELKNALRRRLKHAADEIISKEIEDILGRVKIITTRDLNDGFTWHIKPKPKVQTHDDGD